MSQGQADEGVFPWKSSVYVFYVCGQPLKPCKPVWSVLLSDPGAGKRARVY